MLPNRNATINVDLDLKQLEKIKEFLDPSQPFFQLKLFCTNQSSFDLLHAEIKKNNIKINSIDNNFANLLKKPQLPEQSVDEFLSNLEDSIKCKKIEDDDDEEEEKKGNTPRVSSEKKIDKIDEIKLLYIKTNKKLEEIQDDFQDDDPSLQIAIVSDSIIIKGDRSCVPKVERKVRMLINNLIFRPFDKKFRTEVDMRNFINQEFVQDILTDSGLKILEISPKTPGFSEFGLMFFLEDKDRSGELEEAMRSLVSHRSYSIPLNSILMQNFSEYEKDFYKKKLLQMKCEYIKKYLEEELKEKAAALRLKWVDIVLENKIISVKLDGENEQMNLFQNDLKLFFTNLRTILIISQVLVKKRTYYEVILKNLEIFEQKFLNKETDNSKYPRMLWKKYEESEQIAIVVIIAYLAKEKLEKLNDLGKEIQATINYTEKIVAIDSHYLVKKLKKSEHLKKLEDELSVNLNFNSTKKELTIIGNIDQIKATQERIKEEEQESIREKWIYYFEDPLIFLIFCKYELINLPEYLKKQSLILQSPVVKKETKSVEFLAHPDQKIKLFSSLDEIKSQINSNIQTKCLKYSGKAAYKILTDPLFLKNLINFPSDLKNIGKMVPVEIITNQQKLKNMKLIPNPNVGSQSFCNFTEFTYKNLLNINLHDSNFPSDIELKGLIINIDVKGSYIDKHSEKIAETSDTNRFVAKEINKLNDNGQNKKKRAEVYQIVECRNPSKNYKIFKIFYSIIKNKKLMSNPNINKEIYSMAWDCNTKRIYQNEKKFTYRNNLDLIMKTVLDDKYESLGMIVAADDVLDDICDFLNEFCKNNADFTSLKNIHIFTNDNQENTYLNNKFRQFFNLKNDDNINNNNNNPPIVAIKNNGQASNKNQRKFRWKYLDENKREMYFNEMENQTINSAFQKKAQEIFLVKKLNQGETCPEIFLNLKENKATDLSKYKPLDFQAFIEQNSHLARLVKNYKEMGITSLTYYQGNTVFYRLDFNKKIVEQISNNFNKFPLLQEEQKEEELSFFSENNEENEKVSLFYGITGYPDDIDEAHSKINEELTKAKMEDEFPLPKNIENIDCDRIYKIVKEKKKNQLEINFQDNKIMMKGTKEDINEAKSIIIEEMTLEINKIVENFNVLEYPKEWVMPQDDFCETIKLNVLDKDYMMVEKLFFKSMAVDEIEIHYIHRIQNTSLYQLYFNAKSHLMQHKNLINERYLFHGSTVTNPKIIYNGKDCGFDMRVSNEGMWGKAIYFAENSSYADSYAYKRKELSKNKKIILASVLLGESVKIPFEMEKSNKMTRPPVKNEKKTELYDSVEGETKGTKVYMIYDNNRAYPAYIISYSPKKK